jgi:predicted DNA-binding transcriptional regulator YafY
LNPESLGGPIKTFGLDRLTALEITHNPFKYPEKFEIEEYFRHCFGIISPANEEPVEVILSFNPDQGKYIKSLPLHESQQIIVDNVNELQIKLLIYTTFDFKMELLSYGESVKVLKPDSLIEEVKTSYTNSLLKYQDNNKG